MTEQLEEAIAFARKHGMTVFVGEVSVRVAYPSGEERTFLIDDPEAPKWINDMTCNLL